MLYLLFTLSRHNNRDTCPFMYPASGLSTEHSGKTFEGHFRSKTHDDAKLKKLSPCLKGQQFLCSAPFSASGDGDIADRSGHIPGFVLFPVL